MSRRYDIPLYINEKTFLGAENKMEKVDCFEYFQCGADCNIGDIKIEPFSISHDALDPAGLTIEYENLSN